MIGLYKFNVTLLSTFLSALMLSTLPCPQSAPRERSLSELSLYLQSFTEAENHKLGKFQPRDYDVNERNSHYGREDNYNNEYEKEEATLFDDHVYRKEGYDLAPVNNNSLCDMSNFYENQSIDIYPNGKKLKIGSEIALSMLKENEIIINKFSTSGGLPFGCTQWDLSQILTNKQILKKVTYIALDIGVRKAYIGYYYFIIYLNRYYYKMVQKLGTWFMNLAQSYNTPEHVRAVYWAECKKYLIKDLEVIQEKSTNYFNTLISAYYKVSIVYYKLFLVRCRKLWKRVILNNRIKWSRILSSWVVQYNKEMNLRERENRIRERRNYHADGELRENAEETTERHQHVPQQDSEEVGDLIYW